jgi:hypothetical protein
MLYTAPHKLTAARFVRVNRWTGVANHFDLSLSSMWSAVVVIAEFAPANPHLAMI